MVLDRSQADPVWAGLFYAWQLHVEVGKFFSEPIRTQHEKINFLWFWTGLRQTQYYQVTPALEGSKMSESSSKRVLSGLKSKLSYFPWGD